MNKVIRVLFVDDDALILAGLKRMLRRLENGWEMDFVTSAEDALKLLSLRQFDAVVTDMRMPGMDGAELLKRVSLSHSDVVRLILSGQAADEALLRTIGPAHQFLSKPCAPALLREAMRRALSVRDRLANPAMRKLVSRVSKLPSLPTTYQAIMEEVHSPSSSLRRIGEIVSHDVAMTAKILHLINSSFFGLSQHVESPMHAVGLLGLEVVKALVLTVGIFRQYEQTGSQGFSLERMMQHSIHVGRQAQRYARLMGAEQALVDEALLAGMLHDIGKLVLATDLGQEYVALEQAAQARHFPVWQAEYEAIGCTHADIGGHLLGLWGLPCTIIEAVAFHQEPSAAGSYTRGPLAAVHIANALEHAADSTGSDDSNSTFDHDYLTAVGLTEQAAEWRGEFGSLCVG